MGDKEMKEKVETVKKEKEKRNEEGEDVERNINIGHIRTLGVCKRQINIYEISGRREKVETGKNKG